MTNALGIKNYNKTYSAIEYTLDRQNRYSNGIAIPLWNQYREHRSSISTCKIIGNFADIIYNIPFGEFFGEMIGLYAGGGMKKGDDVAYKLDEATNYIVRITKIYFKYQIEPAFITHFG